MVISFQEIVHLIMKFLKVKEIRQQESFPSLRSISRSNQKKQKREIGRGGRKKEGRDTYCLGKCVHASHKPVCFIRGWAKSTRCCSAIVNFTRGEKYRGRFCKNRRRSGFQRAFLQLSGQEEDRAEGARERSLRASRVKIRERVGVGGFGVADGSANLFYADLASPFDSPGYHCRGKSFFSFFLFFFFFYLSATDDDETFRARTLFQGGGKKMLP